MAASLAATATRAGCTLFGYLAGIQRDVLEYHAHLVGDRQRTQALRAAIDATVRDGDVVLDIGTGTGLLAVYAAAAGARKVYAVESGDVADLASRVIVANGVDDRVVVVRGHSTEVELPERADMLISETLWNAGIGEGLLTSVGDARRRLMRADAAIIPRRLRVLVAPAGGPRLRHRVDRWDRSSGVDLRCLRSIVANLPQAFRVDEGELVGGPAELAEITLTGAPELDMRGCARCAAVRSGTVDGLVVWFEAELARRVSLSNPPGAESSWSQALLPFQEPVAVEQGEDLAIRVEALADGRIWRWALQAARTERSQSTFRADMRTVDAMRRASAGHVPALTRRAEAERFLLDRLDGSRTTGQLRAELREHFPDLFVSEEHVTRFVETVFTRVT
jgi:protein arginine N-methyltransferase 1